MAHFRLPLIADIILPPTVDVMRKRLGGRTGTVRFAGAGDVVNVKSTGKPGVVLTSDETGAYVWVSATEVRRVPADGLSPDAAPTPALEAMAGDARRYARLLEGDVVRFKSETAEEEGRLVEKCRFGALVARVDGSVVAVGFAGLQHVSSD